MLTAIIIEDMADALQLLQSDLENHHPEIKVIDTAQSVVEAAKLLRKTQPDILFLDIMLGDGTGFDILEIFPDLSSKIIFVTAHSYGSSGRQLNVFLYRPHLQYLRSPTRYG